MVNNILAAFSDQLKHADWMDEQTKLSALDKVHSMTLFIGYPEWYHNESALYAFYDGVNNDFYSFFKEIIDETSLKTYFFLADCRT